MGLLVDDPMMPKQYPSKDAVDTLVWCDMRGCGPWADECS